MIHLAAKRVWEEMMSLQQLTRACVSEIGGGGSEATLVVKAKSLALKYLMKSPRIRFVLGPVQGNKLFYGIVIDDDPTSPFTLWSLVERGNELEAVTRIVKGEQLMLALFNEAVVNVCGGILRFTGYAEEIEKMLNQVVPASHAESESQSVEAEVVALLETWKANGTGIIALSSDGNHNWGPNKCFYVTNQLQTSQLDLVHSDEGGQQEQLAAWITDSLHADGVYQNPIAKENVPRELCDLLLTHQFGAILFESKALSILSRPDLPGRDKLKAGIIKHIKKALQQLTGACRNLTGGTEILNRNGVEILVKRDLPQHCIVIIPDLSLLDGIEAITFSELWNFAKKTKAFINIVDLSQLFSLMMDSNNTSHGGQTTPLMAFDYLLIRRFESVIKSRDPGVITLCRFQSSDTDLADPSLNRSQP